MCKIEDNGYIYQFVHTTFEYLTESKKTVYKGINLKNDYLINIMHELIIKYFFSENGEIKYNLFSEILRKKYGKHYNVYIDYIVSLGFMSLVSDYYVGLKSKTYKMNFPDEIFKKVKIRDTVLLKKHKRDYLVRTFSQNRNSPINLGLREKLISDLYHVNLDYELSKSWLNEQKEKKELCVNKYMKNTISINNINDGYIYYIFDSYGRLHTNFTSLKKHIRKNFIRIDDKEVMELDIKNSQPLFLGLLLKEEIGEENFNQEVKHYIEIVKNGLIYELFLEKYPNIFKNRKQVKLMIYRVFFGNNNNPRDNKYFQKEFPTVFNYIVELKKEHNTYKYISCKLQQLESELIFNKIILDVKKNFPHIRLYTVHDSIIFPIEYKEEVSIIFNNYIRNVL